MLRRTTLLTAYALLAVALGAAAPGSTAPAQKTTEVKVYLVRLGDAGRSGQKIGCDDSLYAVKRTIAPTRSPLKAAINELLSMSEEEGNYWRGENLKLKSASVSRGTATIRITGRGPFVAGICDEPRIIKQMEETARQFPTVRRVRVFVNGVPLALAVR